MPPARRSQTSSRSGSRANSLDRGPHPLPELVVGLGRTGDADDREPLGQEAAEGQRVERRDQLPAGQVAGGAEDRERARLGRPPHPQSLEQRVLGLAAAPSPSFASLQVPAEGAPHRREDAVAELRLASRGEAVEERRCEHGRGHALLDGGLHRPAALAGVARPVPSTPRAAATRAAPARSGRAAMMRPPTHAARPRSRGRGRARSGSARGCAAASSLRRAPARPGRRSRAGGRSDPRRRPA